MSAPNQPPDTPLTREDELSALFGNLVIQQANMALMLMGKTPNPAGGEVTKDLEAAQYFIDQLEMLETKTKGNLNPQEAGLLKQTLMTLRLAFVEAVDKPESRPHPSPETLSTAPPEAKAAEPPPKAAEVQPKAEEESHKKFSKKY